MNTIAQFVDKHGDEVAVHTYEHVYLCFFTLVIAVGIAVPLGVVLAHCRRRSLVALVMMAASVVQTIPGLALIALIVVLCALAGWPTIGAFPAMIALVLYALLPILRNTYTGLRQINPTVIEVARGMGMRPRQVLFQVELPLSLPVIMAGIRTATVWTIGIATLCALIGAGGLGDLIMRGLRSIQIDYLLAGTIPAAILAVVADWTLGQIEQWLAPQTRSRKSISES
ncbi:MAG: ABC transporter permease [Pirellulales bacterium]|nr:ABC transporter permease [Pirellulales bacterium]